MLGLGPPFFGAELPFGPLKATNLKQSHDLHLSLQKRPPPKNSQNFFNVKISRPFYKKKFKCGQMTSRTYKIIDLVLLALFGAFGDFGAFLAPLWLLWDFWQFWRHFGDFGATFNVLSHIMCKKVIRGHSNAKIFSFFSILWKKTCEASLCGLTSSQIFF